MRGRREITSQKIEKSAPAPAAVAMLQLQPLKENQRSEYVRVAQRLHARLFGLVLAQFLDRLLQCALDRRCVWILRARLVNQTRLERAIRPDQCFERLPRVKIHRSLFIHRARHLHGKPHHHFLVFAQELLAYTNVLVWKTIGGDRRRPLMPSSLLTVLTIGLAVDRIFPLRAAADRTDVAPDAGTIPSCALLLTEFARIVHQRIISIVSSGHAADRPVSQGGARSR